MTVSMLLKSPATPPASRPTASIFWACDACASNWRRLPTSRNTRMAPRRSPESPRTGAALSSTGTRAPPREMRAMCSPEVTVARSRMARITGLSMASWVRSSMRRRTSTTAFLRTSAPLQPVSVSATGFRNVMRPSSSVARTASPMLARVEANTRRPSRHSAVIQMTMQAMARNDPRRTPTTQTPGADGKKKTSRARAEAALAANPMVSP